MTRRTNRISHLLQEEISELLRREIKDPRLGGFITVTRVSTSADLCHARVSISIIGSDDEREKVLQALTAASGFFHKQLKARLTMRRIPELSFHYDDTVEKGTLVLQMINQVAGSSSEEKPESGEH